MFGRKKGEEEEPVPYSYWDEERLIKSGDFFGWLDHIKNRPSRGLYEDIATIAYNAALIAIRNEKAGTAEMK